MKIEALNCPNCGAGVSSDKTQCEFCKTRLKTIACTSCLSLMFEGSKHCSMCGKETIVSETPEETATAECPRCKKRLSVLKIDQVSLLECLDCGGYWCGTKTFEEICADRESQASVLGFAGGKEFPKKPASVSYVPCPECKQLMNRSNFSKNSGVILDICRQHGVWFDPDELPKIIEFIRKGGLDHARKKEKLMIEEQRRDLLYQQRQLDLDSRLNRQGSLTWGNSDSNPIRDFVKMLFD